MFEIGAFKVNYIWAVAVVKGAACLPSLTIRVRIPLKPTVCYVKFVFEKERKNKMRPGWTNLKSRSY